MEASQAGEKVVSRDDVLRILREEIPYLKEYYGVERIALYGSFAHGHPRAGSDVDLLVELGQPLGLEFIDMVYYLEHKLGRKVEVATFETLNHCLRQPHRRETALGIRRSFIDVEAEAG